MTLPPDALPPRPGLAGCLLGVLRLVVGLALIVGGTVVILACALAPRRIGHVSPAERVAQRLSAALLAVAGVRVEAEGRDRLAAHRGFVFFNHLSYLDPLVLAAVAPMRFLATAGVRKLPFIGWIATALGTLYVRRGRGASRTRARESLRHEVQSSPVPIALAPEGRIGPGPRVQPLRHGAFEVAADAQAPILLAGLQFEPYSYVAWLDGEWLLRAWWRLCARTEPVTATVRVLGDVAIRTRSDAPFLARHAESVFNRDPAPAAPPLTAVESADV